MQHYHVRKHGRKLAALRACLSQLPVSREVFIGTPASR
jgi:hypothetical protein